MCDVPQILIGKLGKTMRMFHAWLKISKLIRLTFKEKTPGKAGFPNLVSEQD